MEQITINKEYFDAILKLAVKSDKLLTVKYLTKAKYPTGSLKDAKDYIDEICK